DGAMDGKTFRGIQRQKSGDRAKRPSRRRVMRKWVMAGACAAAVGAAAALVGVQGLRARPAARGDEEPAARAAQLPIGQVVLFSSGVGYFQREGAVEGDARVDLSFPVSDINDLIKSMVVRDLDGGHISG